MLNFPNDDGSHDSVLQYPPAQAINFHILLNVFVIGPESDIKRH